MVATMSLSAREFRRRGVPDEDIRTARMLQEVQRRTGSPVQSLNTIITGQNPPATDPADLTARQLRKRGRYGTAAILADQEALTEKEPVRALKARHASAILKELANKPQQLEFDFFKGNRMIADDFHDAVRDRLNAMELTFAKRAAATTVLAEICRHLPWEGHTCTKTAVEIGDILKIARPEISDTLAILEQIGAIHRVKRGRTKVITVTPEGAFRGRVDHHAEAVASYKKTLTDAGNVVPLRGDRI